MPMMDQDGQVSQSTRTREALNWLSDTLLNDSSVAERKDLLQFIDRLARSGAGCDMAGMFVTLSRVATCNKDEWLTLLAEEIRSFAKHDRPLDIEDLDKIADLMTQRLRHPRHPAS